MAQLEAQIETALGPPDGRGGVHSPDGDPRPRPSTICSTRWRPCRCAARKMFGEYALYLDGKVVALVCDDQLFLKPTPGRWPCCPTARPAPPYPGAKLIFSSTELWMIPMRSGPRACARPRRPSQTDPPNAQIPTGPGGETPRPAKAHRDGLDHHLDALHATTATPGRGGDRQGHRRTSPRLPRLIAVALLHPDHRRPRRHRWHPARR